MAGRKISLTSSGRCLRKKAERRPQIWLGCGDKFAVARTNNGWPGDNFATSIPLRTMDGSANNTAPSGFLPSRDKRRRDPVSVRTGITVRAYTTGSSSHSRRTSRTKQRSCGSTPKACASFNIGRCQTWLTGSTRNWPRQECCNRLVREVGSSNQSKHATGAP